MDVLFRLRFIFWVLVIGLWGLMFRDFYFDSRPEIPKIQPIHNPFRSSAASIPSLPPAAMTLDAHRAPPEEAPGPFLPPSAQRVARESERLPPPVVPQAKPPVSESPEPIAPGDLKAPSERIRASVPKPAPEPLREPPPDLLPIDEPAPRPEARPRAPSRRAGGFLSTETRHYQVLSETDPGDEFLATLETLHTNLMVDLAPFSPWARDQKATLYLFETQASYQKHTGRPSWSGGASSLSRRTVYVYKSDELMGILAHELCHIYFDGFFGTRQSPLWLSEGLATLVQAERGFSPPNWLTPNLERLAEGDGYAVERLVKVNTTAGSDDDAVRLWYSQSYSLVRFLLRMQRGSSFLHFCREVRDGKALNQALLAAYGMPYNRLRALEHAWRFDLETHRLTSRLPGDAVQ